MKPVDVEPRPAPSDEERTRRTRDPAHAGPLYLPTSAKEWVRITHYDLHGRRALWIRCSKGCIELRAGRDGDDAYVSFAVGDTINARALCNLKELLETVMYGADACNNHHPDGGCAHCEPATELEADDSYENWAI